MDSSGRMTPADFKSIRESLGLSAQWLADAVHVDQRTVRRWEDGEIPLREDVVRVLTELDQQVAFEVDRERVRILTGLGYDIEDMRALDQGHLLDHLEPGDWPVLEVPRVDADAPAITQANALLAKMVQNFRTPLPAAFYRAVASRLRWALGGRLRITYFAAG